MAEILGPNSGEQSSEVATPTFDRAVGAKLKTTEPDELEKAREVYAVHKTFGSELLQLSENLGGKPGSASEAYGVWWKKQRRDKGLSY